MFPRVFLTLLVTLSLAASAQAAPPKIPEPAHTAPRAATTAPHVIVPATPHAAPPPAEIHLGAPEVSRTATITDQIRSGGAPKSATPQELVAAQSHALHTVQSLFHDRNGGDGALLHAVDSKVGAFPIVLHPDATLSARPVTRQQVDALQVVLHTFKGTEGGDVGLRAAAFDKLGAMGKAEDVSAMMPLLRKPLHSEDLRAGLQAAHSILARGESPVPRGDQHLSTEVKALLKKPQLTPEERITVVKEVLAHGEIVSVQKNVSPTMNAVYFLKFKETVPGPDGKLVPIEGVWKAETTFNGKQKPNFSREVAAFEFTHRFTKSDIVPVTVEGMLSPSQLPGENKPFGVGSIQYKVPGGESMGRGYPDAGQLKPKFEAYVATPEGKRQMDEIRAHLFIMNDPEKLPSPGGYDGANYGNILAVPDAARPGGFKLLMIDNGTALGAQSQFGTSIRPEMLPNHPTHATTELSHTSGEEIQKMLAPMIGDFDAADVANRVKTATSR